MQLSCTDIGNAQRLMHHYGDVIRYCTTWKRWLIWDGTRWAIDMADRIVALAKKTTRKIFAEVADCDDDKDAEALTKWAKASANVMRIKAMITLTQPDCSISPDDLDSNPWIINCINGTIDLKTGALLPHCKTDYITKRCPIAYDPTAISPLWDQYFGTFFPKSPDLVMYLQRAAGYAITGLSTEKALFLLEGDGDNGKTTFVETIMAAIGDYGDQIHSDTLLITKNEKMSTDIARMKGLRVLVSSETDPGKRLAEAKIKSLTGGGKQFGEMKYGDPFTFNPTHTIFFDTNYAPDIRGTDNAIWNRVKSIVFPVQLEKSQIDTTFNARLRTEFPGIFNWLVEGCLAYQRDGLNDPLEVCSAVSTFRAEMDTLSHWVDTCCIVSPDCTASGKQLYTSYVQWCKETGEREITYIKLSKWMVKRRKFIKEERLRRDGQYWQGVGLLSEGLPPETSVF